MGKTLSTILILCVIITSSFFIRFYNYPNRINFSAEQGLALGTSADYIHNRISLLGQKTFLRTTSKGHMLFSGSLYNYSLVPLLILFKYQPLPITAFFTLFNIVTGILIFILVKKMINKNVAMLSTTLFLFNSVMINHSMFIWILNYIPMVGMLTIFVIWIYKYNPNIKSALSLGILGGVGINLEYFYLFTIVLVGVILFLLSANKIRDMAIYFLGLAMGNWTMILFDLRHNLYYTKTLLQYFLDTMANPGQSHISYYHFLQFWPFFIILIALALDKIFYLNKVFALTLLLIYLIINLFSPKISLSKAIGMSEGMNYPKIYNAAQTIANENPMNFNLVSLNDSDFRAYALRYLEKYVFNKNPESLENYNNIGELYILANSNFNIGNNQPWEIQTFNAKRINLLINLDGYNMVYKLSK